MRNLLDELGFPPGLDLHSLRRAYATHLQTEYGYDLSFVQMQLGHEHAATTSIYTIASPPTTGRATWSRCWRRRCVAVSVDETVHKEGTRDNNETRNPVPMAGS